jgi:hippurate hydrolase
MRRPFVFVVLLFLFAIVFTAACPAEEPADWARQHIDEIVAVYRHFHQHPELSLHETETAARLAQEWKSAGFEVTSGVGDTGVVAVLKNGPGPTLMLRTDLDGLPVTEATNLVYASKVEVTQKDGRKTGVMHACGHDVHITNLVGVARYMGANKDRWSGTLVLIGQPAEEVVAGARKMLADGLYTKFPKPDFALAMHVDSTLEAGKLGYNAGYDHANVDSIDITLRGRGGHGAAPHTTIDPIVMAARLILDLQTLVSRETNPIEPAVVTVGSIHAGTKRNIVPDTCLLQLTVRSYSDAVRKHLVEGIERKARAVAEGAGAPAPEVKRIAEESMDSVFNDKQLVERLVPVWKKLLGDDNVLQRTPTMGAEDFSLYGKEGVPIFMIRLGSVEAHRLAGLKRGGQEPPSLHSATYYPDADLALQTGVTAMSAAALELLRK